MKNPISPMLGLCPNANSESTCSPSALSFPCALVKAKQTAVICSSVFSEFLRLATVDWVVKKRDGRRGISNAKKVLDAVKDYVEMGEVWA